MYQKDNASINIDLFFKCKNFSNLSDHFQDTRDRVLKMIEEHVENCRNTEPNENEHEEFVSALFNYLRWGKLPKEKKIKKSEKNT